MKNNFLKTVALFLVIIALAACEEKKEIINYPQTDLAINTIIPKPLKVIPTNSGFGLDSSTVIYTNQTVKGFENVGKYLAEKIKHQINLDVPVNTSTEESATRMIFINQTDSLPLTSPEAYELYIKNDSIILNAKNAAGAFRGIQTLRQLIPEKSNDTLSSKPMWVIPSGKILDEPNFSYRGAMLDVARHFFTVDEVKKYIDLLAYYKFNKFHMHLTDDQGWRIEIKSWPKLTEIGGASEVGGGEGGFYTQEDFKALVAYAADRHIEIIPEVDLPGHTNAASLSYPFLHDANGRAKTPRVRTDMLVGYSSFDVRKDTVYTFLDDVIGEIAAISPSKYFHIGGDETFATTKKDYLYFVERVEAIVEKHGKNVIGWNEISQANISPNSVHQLWKEVHHSLEAVKNGSKIILSPGKKMYLDMKYDNDTKLGLTWAGLIPVDSAYQWNPETYIEELDKDDILGIEAPLWSETISNLEELEYLAFPRVIGYSELGWSVQKNRNWEDYTRRLKGHQSFLEKEKVNYYPSAKIPWN